MKIKRLVEKAKISKKKGGFTLLELIVVIAIIAVLATALTPQLTSYINEAKKAAVIAQARQVVTAYSSASLSDNSITTSTSISTLDGVTDLIEAEDYDKISSECTVADCISVVKDSSTMVIEDGIMTGTTGSTNTETDTNTAA